MINYRQAATTQARRALQTQLPRGQRPYSEGEVFGRGPRSAEAQREAGIAVALVGLLVGAGVVLSRNFKKGGKRR